MPGHRKVLIHEERLLGTFGLVTLARERWVLLLLFAIKPTKLPFKHESCRLFILFHFLCFLRLSSEFVSFLRCRFRSFSFGNSYFIKYCIQSAASIVSNYKPKIVLHRLRCTCLVFAVLTAVQTSIQHVNVSQSYANHTCHINSIGQSKLIRIKI